MQELDRQIPTVRNIKEAKDFFNSKKSKIGTCWCQKEGKGQYCFSLVEAELFFREDKKKARTR